MISEVVMPQMGADMEEGAVIRPLSRRGRPSGRPSQGDEREAQP